jgi:mono/diheme cytochrome c family protein
MGHDLRSQRDCRRRARLGCAPVLRPAVVKDEKRVRQPFPKEDWRRGWTGWCVAVAAFAFPLVASAADVVQGATLYRQHCAGCHGGNGRPVMPMAPDFTRPASLLKPDLALLAAIRTGRGAMPAYQGQLRDRDILDIVAHLRTLR